MLGSALSFTTYGIVGGKMIVYSFQHKNVLANLIKYKIYNCTYASQYRNQAPILYSLLQ